MKILFKVVVFLKNAGIIGRIIVIGVTSILLTNVFLPDLIFNLEVKNPKRYTIEEIRMISKENLPRYIVLDSAQTLYQSAMLGTSDSRALSNDTIKESSLPLPTESYSYVLSQHVNKKGDTTISSIFYPVYSKKEVEENPNPSITNMTCYVVIEDVKVTKAMLENDSYFTNSSFSIAGRFDGSEIGKEELSILTDSGYLISDNVILLKKGLSLLSLNSSIILTLLASVFLILFILSFMPLGLLVTIFMQDQENR